MGVVKAFVAAIVKNTRLLLLLRCCLWFFRIIATVPKKSYRYDELYGMNTYLAILYV